MKNLIFLLICLCFCELSFAESIYKENLPEEVYSCLKKHCLLDENASEVHKEVHLHRTARLDIIQNDDNSLEIHFYPAMDLQLSEIIIGYRSGKLIGYAFIDHEGRDYVPMDDITEEDEIEMQSLLLKSILPAFNVSTSENDE